MNILDRIDEYFLMESAFDDVEQILIKKKVAPEDVVKDVIEKYKKNRIKAKGNEKDIRYWEKQPFERFASFVETLSQAKTEREKIRGSKGEAITVFDKNGVKVIIPETESASCEYGKGTKWCTAGKVDNHFKEYLHEKGHTLYYIIVNNGIDESLMYDDNFVTKYHGNGEQGRQHGGKYTIDQILPEQKQIRELYLNVDPKTYNRLAVLVRNETITPEMIADAKRRGKTVARLIQPFDIFDNYMKSSWFKKFLNRYGIPEDTFTLRTSKDDEDKYQLRK